MSSLPQKEMEHSSQAWTCLRESYNLSSLRGRQSTSLSTQASLIQGLAHLRYGLSEHPKERPTMNLFSTAA